MMHFVRTFLIMRAQGVKLIAIEEVKIMEKLYTSKTFLKMAGEGCIASTSILSSYPPGSALGHGPTVPP